MYTPLFSRWRRRGKGVCVKEVRERRMDGTTALPSLSLIISARPFSPASQRGAGKEVGGRGIETRLANLQAHTLFCFTRTRARGHANLEGGCGALGGVQRMAARVGGARVHSPLFPRPPSRELAQKATD